MRSHSQGDIQDHADILDLCPSKILKNRNKIKQFIVMCVREPATDGYRVLRVEDVRGGRVVDDDGFAEITANLRKVLPHVRVGLTGPEGPMTRKGNIERTYLDVISLMVVATLSE